MSKRTSGPPRHQLKLNVPAGVDEVLKALAAQWGWSLAEAANYCLVRYLSTPEGRVHISPNGSQSVQNLDQSGLTGTVSLGERDQVQVPDRAQSVQNLDQQGPFSDRPAPPAHVLSALKDFGNTPPILSDVELREEQQQPPYPPQDCPVTPHKPRSRPKPPIVTDPEAVIAEAVAGARAREALWPDALEAWLRACLTLGCLGGALASKVAIVDWWVKMVEGRSGCADLVQLAEDFLTHYAQPDALKLKNPRSALQEIWLPKRAGYGQPAVRNGSRVNGEPEEALISPWRDPRTGKVYPYEPR